MHLMLNVFKHVVAMTLDVKDAFLMAEQPAEERAFVVLDGQIYKFIKCLPGQRTAASEWFQLFVGASKKYGLEQDPMRPTLLMMKKEMYITMHVDDIFMVGNETALKGVVQYLQKKRGWNIEVKGPFNVNEKFHYLKREFLGLEVKDVTSGVTTSNMRALPNTPMCTRRHTGRLPWTRTSPRRMKVRCWKERTSQSTAAWLRD